MAHFELAPGRVSRAVAHRAVEELWYILAGQGQMWRRQGERQQTVPLRPGTCLSIPAGTHSQFRASAGGPLAAVGVTIPPWPGDADAYEVPGAWPAHARPAASPGNAVLPGALPGPGWRPTVVEVTRRGGGHAVRARIARAGATRTGPARARAALATPETPGQRRSGADGRAGGRAGQGFPRADPLRGGPRQGREPDRLGNERGSVPRRGSLLLQVRGERGP